MAYKTEKTPGKPTVFLVQENPYISVLSAEEYGEIETYYLKVDHKLCLVHSLRYEN